MELTPERMEKIIKLLAKEIIEQLNADEVVAGLSGSKDWTDIFSDRFNGEEHESFYSFLDGLFSGKDGITEDEFSDLVRPHLADCLKKEFQSIKQITIEWGKDDESDPTEKQEES